MQNLPVLQLASNQPLVGRAYSMICVEWLRKRPLRSQVEGSVVHQHQVGRGRGDRSQEQIAARASAPCAQFLEHAVHFAEDDVDGSGNTIAEYRFDDLENALPPSGVDKTTPTAQNLDEVVRVVADLDVIGLIVSLRKSGRWQMDWVQSSNAVVESRVRPRRLLHEARPKPGDMEQFGSRHAIDFQKVDRRVKECQTPRFVGIWTQPALARDIPPWPDRKR